MLLESDVFLLEPRGDFSLQLDTMADSAKLFIGRLGPDVRQRDLEDLFSQYGRIRACTLKSTFGFVVCLLFFPSSRTFFNGTQTI